MRTIGLLGGMSWESTVTYYREINRGVKQRLGGLHSAKLAMVSVDFAEIERMQHAGDWAGTAELLSAAAISVERAGAEALLICTNTMHKIAEEVQSAVSIPLLHIADATALALQSAGISKIGLLGTAFTMEQSFYRGRLEHHAIEVLTPNSTQRAEVHRVIYDELCNGVISSTSRQAYLQIIDALVEQGADAIVLGCTEIGLLVTDEFTSVPLFDTAAIHAQAAVDFMLDPVSDSRGES
ncbi:aspartate/glutamate racemase family protein [Arenicella xantha]|uniref:Aspartate racemase n=1 Tax=Arenicella xantha TaxID=644221 RepID=A0A395JMY7_9GAMM|nr:aspartate/glutamate racemase family protein [Arenicella xantha]RBP52837.1 aspartate racemase [Arenicella xantha]